jgi:hypothetical protein
MVDDRDPAAHWAMGRALWLRGHLGQSLVELEQAIDLSPNFALGHYALAFVHSQAGEPKAAIRSSDHSRHLSPFDPLLFGMLGARAMALARLGQFGEAADWGARPPPAPTLMRIFWPSPPIVWRWTAGSTRRVPTWPAIRQRLPDDRVDDFLGAMQFAPDDASLFRDGARRIGIR